MKEFTIEARQLAGTIPSSDYSVTAGIFQDNHLGPSNKGTEFVSLQRTSQLLKQGTHGANPTTAAFPLLNLTPELVLIVFDNLRNQDDWCTLTCLGLTCTYLYHTLKERYHPNPISLEHYIWKNVEKSIRESKSSGVLPRRIIDYVALVELLKDFIGPKYRLLGGVFPPVFVRREVYGDKDRSDNQLEKYLCERLWDYKMMTYKSWATGQTTHMLPNPFYKGAGWYDEVFERWMEFEKLGWAQDMLEYWRGNMRYTHAAKILFKKYPYKVSWLWIK